MPIQPTRDLLSQAAALDACLAGTAAELHYLAWELPHLSRNRREFSRAQLAMACRRLLTEAEDLCRLRDRIEAIEDGTALDAESPILLVG